MNNVEQKKDVGKRENPRNYRNPDPLNCGLEGKILTVTLTNGRTESGTCQVMGQYFLELKAGNGRPIILSKAQIVTVSVMT